MTLSQSDAHGEHGNSFSINNVADVIADEGELENDNSFALSLFQVDAEAAPVPKLRSLPHQRQEAEIQQKANGSNAQLNNEGGSLQDRNESYMQSAQTSSPVAQFGM